MNSATITIEHNPETGAVRPFEVYFQVGHGKKSIVSSCESAEKAKKSAEKCAKRNDQFYNISRSY